MKDWPFDQAENVAAITTVNVLEKKYPILLVVHYEDDHSWAFLCGKTNNEQDGRVVSMKHAIDMDPTLADLADLPPGWKAWRQDQNSPWQRYRDAQ